MSETFKKVKKIVAEVLIIDESSIKEDSSIIDDLGADSLDMVELVMAIEEAFDIEIPGEAEEEIKTVGDAVKFIKRN